MHNRNNNYNNKNEKNTLNIKSNWSWNNEEKKNKIMCLNNGNNNKKPQTFKSIDWFNFGSKLSHHTRGFVPIAIRRFDLCICHREKKIWSKQQSLFHVSVIFLFWWYFFFVTSLKNDVYRSIEVTFFFRTHYF